MPAILTMKVKAAGTKVSFQKNSSGISLLVVPHE